MSRWIAKNKRLAIYARDNYTCAYCGVTVRVGNTRDDDFSATIATLDHIVSQKTLASAAIDDRHFGLLRRDEKNLVCTCMKCNSSKRHTELFIWCQMTGKNYIMIETEIMRRVAIPIGA